MEEERRQTPYDEEEIDLYELWQNLVRKKKVVLSVFISGVLLATLFALLSPKVYRAEVSLMPISPQQSSGLHEIAGQLLGLPVKSGGDASKVMAILESRTIKERVVKRLNLTEKLLTEPPEERDPLRVAVEKIEDMVSVSQDRRTGLIRLGVEYTDPELARDIAEAYVEELRAILEEKALTLAKMNRRFLEEQLRKTEKELREVLGNMVEFQKKEKVIVPQEQVKGTIELYSELLAKKIALQVELRKLESVLSPDSPQVKHLREQVKAIEVQLRNIENAGDTLSAVPSLEGAPQKMAEYTNLYIKVKGLQAKYETLLKLYEQARIEEQRENLYVEVIDPPSLPDVPVKPKRTLIVAVAAVSSLFLGIFLAFFFVWLEGVKSRRVSA